ncbi:hypothetical protein N5J77_27490 [Sphingobium yanoikuyae]|uniref:Uncharacterized protein n=1 Tax=Sphingobium yanoikuyae TaxID=13690 RepID=A0AA43BAV7_SPHYA|nr:hypothetical protein [Sphingobium yanoikuyae]MDH2134881.1 hypothetical protein [Sphingobium yanoikuyae]MDH2152711.1 hypothetical protein [Sphingobium yanoikuyae]MDH2170208.1 hypothetical protein [Sphingobium yanoikuyae]
MSRKGKGFASLADAASALMDLRTALAGTNASSRSPDRKPQTASGDFIELEQQMLAKQAAGQSIEKVSPSPSSFPARSEVGKRAPDPVHKAGKKKGKKAQPQPKPKGPKKIILKGPGMKAAYHAILEAERAAAVKKPTPAAAKPAPSREKIFREVIAAVSNTTPMIEPRPVSITPQNQAAIERAIVDGAAQLAENLQPDLDDGFIVGFDFGTSSVKLAVSQPYHADNPTKAMPAPEGLQSFGHPYLWQTALWLDPKAGRLSLYPIPGAVTLEGFKTGIIGAHGGELVRPDVNVTRVEAAAAFLALHFAHFFGWYRQAKPLGPAGADQFMAVNVGIPVAAHDDARSFSIFKRIVAAAVELAPFASRLTPDLVRQTHSRSPDRLPTGFYLVPELTAAVAGYAFAPTSQPGSHMLVDVGASTLDIVAFNLVGRERVAVFSAAVELLGAAALDSALSRQLSAGDFKRACDHEFEEVYGRARSPERAQDGFHAAYRRKPVQLLVTGGGCKTEVHDRFIAEMPTERVLGAAPTIHPLPPKAMTDMSCDRSRLLLAYGLTRDLPDLPEIKLPSQVPSITPLVRMESSFVGPEMT